MSENEINPGNDFIRSMIKEDIKNNKNDGKVITRFPPEPNGYLHIGHAKSICLNFGIAKDFNGRCHLRFDDTNPEKESTDYINAIMEDIKWLGFDWKEHLYYASDYYEQLYQYALELIKSGKAYVCHLTAEQTREYRGTLTEPGKESPYRNRSVEENLELFEKMKNGEFKDGECVLRAKIDMTSPNMNMRDSTIYRIKKVSHHRTGDQWNIYPMYDFAHGLSDSIEGITHSICTLEFEDHRPLYDWYLDQLPVKCHPQQIEFARLNLTYTVMSKRKLLELVQDGHVEGWDDPRMPTISGFRRKGFTPASIKDFAYRIGVAKKESMVDYALLEYCLREDLNKKAKRVMAVLRPLKVVITNYPEDQVEWMDAENNPEEPESGVRKIPFSKEIYIEEDDFMENPPKKYFRLSPGKEIRLKHAYYITCVDVIKDEKTGKIIEVHCTYDPATKGGWSNDGRKVKGTSHWVSKKHAINAEIRLYDHLFTKENPNNTEEGKTYLDYINPDSLEILKDSQIEPSLKEAKLGENYQFLRQGYFCLDKLSTPDTLIFNKTVSLRDTWAKIQKKNK